MSQKKFRKPQIVDSIFVDFNGSYHKTPDKLKEYIKINYAFEKQTTLVTRSFIIVLAVAIITVGIGLSFLALHLTTLTTYKINLFEVQIYKNGRLTKELNTHDCQCIYFQKTNLEEINSYTHFVELIIMNCLNEILHVIN